MTTTSACRRCRRLPPRAPHPLSSSPPLLSSPLLSSPLSLCPSIRRLQVHPHHHDVELLNCEVDVSSHVLLLRGCVLSPQLSTLPPELEPRGQAQSISSELCAVVFQNSKVHPSALAREEANVILRYAFRLHPSMSINIAVPSPL